MPTEAPPDEAVEPLPDLESTPVFEEVYLEEPKIEEKPQLRFAEEILVTAPSKPGAKLKKKKKKSTRGKESGEENIRTTKLRRDTEITDDEEY